MKKILNYFIVGLYLLFDILSILVASAILLIVYVPLVTMLEFIKAIIEALTLIKTSFKEAIIDANIYL